MNPPEETGPSTKAGDAAPGNNAAPGDADSGPLLPQDGDEIIPDGVEPGQVMAKIALVCDNETAALLFRYNQTLYFRVVSPGNGRESGETN